MHAPPYRRSAIAALSAEDGARRAAGPRLRAMLSRREAWALARMDRPSGFRRAIGQAVEALGDAGRFDNDFGEAELAGVTGGSLLDLVRSEPRAYAD
ncbi:conserved hypothetical protein [Streptomyces himastatinicus ATCC 53653]|uniref:Uncharacterized protein n=1 Tax=Streptomyces himastatinicus ATCC 53653 TaxID=457427 RepID=D9WD83_9ACTN|nr:conserved hypothetical protein [Streptomyces himastatinicus ATCC 53653]